METNEMEPGTRDEGREALEEFQRGHDEMGGAIAVRGFQLQHDLTGPGAAEPFVAEGGARDVAAQPFELLALLGPTAGVGMQAKPLGTDTALGIAGLLDWRGAARGLSTSALFGLLGGQGPCGRCRPLRVVAPANIDYLTLRRHFFILVFISKQFVYINIGCFLINTLFIFYVFL